MPHPLPVACPVCEKALRVSRLRCGHCGTALEGDFELARLARLSNQQRQFVISFLRCRGNIREMEKEYSISYPTVRSRIDDILRALGESPSAEVPQEPQPENGRKTFRREILDKLSSGEIDAKTAQGLLEKL